MKTTCYGFVLAASVAAGMLPVKDANAGDTKVYAGSGCKVFGSTAWSDLQFGANGIINLTNVPKNVICPIVKDVEADYDGTTNYGYVHLHTATGAVAARTVCNIYTINGDSGGTVLNTYTLDSGTRPASSDLDQTTTTLVGSAANGGSHVSMMMLCTLGPQARLRFYYLSEIGATNS